MDNSSLQGRRDGDHFVVLAGTTDGLYLLIADEERRIWEQRGPYIAGCDVFHAAFDPRDGSIWATANSGKAQIVRSADLGQTWSERGEPFHAESIWHIEPGRAEEPQTVYAGIKPAALYRSQDGGETWQPLSGLNEHETRGEWWPGGAGLILHTTLLPEERPGRIYAGISVAGLFRSDDDGKHWTPINRGIAEFPDLEVTYPEVHRCVHKVVIHPSNPDVMFQQNHDGIYRSDDGGDNWVDIGGDLPSRFGFPIAITADPEPVVCVIPQNEETLKTKDYLAVWRSSDSGASWQEVRSGLPDGAHTVLREAMAADNRTPGGLYFGNKAGSVFASNDSGRTFTEIASGLPAVRSIKVAYAG